MSHAENATEISKLIRVNNFVPGEIYLLQSQNGGIHRVKIIENVKNANQLECDCFFIDIGKYESIKCGQLFHCNYLYDNITPQAICFKLYGFDEFNNCPHILNVQLNAWLINKQFLGCVMMTEKQYHIQLNNGIQIPKISITLFNFYPKLTLSKPILMKQFGSSLPEPIFSHNQLQSAKVSHISSMGLVYFQLDQLTINYIESLIQNIVNEKQEPLYRANLNDKNENATVLIYDEQRKQYVRAKIIDSENETLKSKSFRCMLMDYGDVRSVEVANIFALNANSILNYYPNQAVPAKLNLLLTFDDIILQRLHNILLSCEIKIQVKAINRMKQYPVVTIFKQSKNSTVNVNELIRMEIELQT